MKSISSDVLLSRCTVCGITRSRNFIRLKSNSCPSRELQRGHENIYTYIYAVERISSQVINLSQSQLKKIQWQASDEVSHQ